MSKEYLDTINDELDKLMAISKQIMRLSGAFNMTGNYQLGDKLEYISSSVLESKDGIRKAVNDELHTQYKNAQQSSVNVLNAALAGSGSKKLINT